MPLVVAGQARSLAALVSPGLAVRPGRIEIVPDADGADGKGAKIGAG